MPKSPESVTALNGANGVHDHRDKPVSGSLEDQLRDLYRQRQELQFALGTADSQAIIAMVRSLEQQLKDLYMLFKGKRDHLPEPEDGED